MSGRLSRLDGLTVRLSGFLCFIAGVALLAMMVQVTLDALMRYVFNSPLSGTVEIVSAYHMLVVVFFPLAYVARKGGHIVVTLFTQKLPLGALDVLERCVNALGFGVLVLIIWMTVNEAVFRTVERETWDAGNLLIQVWPSRWGIPIGCAAMALFLVIDTIGRRAQNRRPSGDRLDTSVG